MNFTTKHKYFLIAFLITLVNAIFGSLLAIDGMEEWYPALIKPLDIPLWFFAIVQPLYYCICIFILYRLFSYVEESRKRIFSLSIYIFMMVYAESWNYFFLGLRNVSLGFWSMLGFGTLAFTVYLVLRKTEKISSHVFIPYLILVIS